MDGLRIEGAVLGADQVASAGGHRRWPGIGEDGERTRFPIAKERDGPWCTRPTHQRGYRTFSSGYLTLRLEHSALLFFHKTQKRLASQAVYCQLIDSEDALFEFHV